MMTIMRMRCAILTIAYCIAVSQSLMTFSWKILKNSRVDHFDQGGMGPIPGFAFQGRKFIDPWGGPGQAADRCQGSRAEAVSQGQARREDGAVCPPAEGEKFRRRRLYLFANVVL
jgi:hypothetical protein